ncbi:MAG TPA: ATP-binding cassette domain-containing protein [Polyangiaceae bacterium]|nr:ATP-binding cassette domain-containing protein [Polyangiaceae bacterium]
MSLTRPQLFECRQLKVGIGGRAILPAIDLAIKSGEFWAVVGRNGAGKTIWLKTLIGLLAPVEGQVASADGVRVSYIPQRSGMDELYPLLAREVVEMGTERGWSFVGWKGGAERRRRVQAALAEVGASELAERPFRRLSEGQKQRVLMARLAVSGAELAILDEPTSAMDKVAEREAFEALRELQQRHQLAVLVVSHYLSLVRRFADHALLLDADTPAVVVGSPDEVFGHEVFRARYGDFAAEAVSA